MIILVTYHLKGSADGYKPFYDALKSQGRWWHYLPSTWLLSTDKTPQQISENLQPHLQISLGDRILIAEMGKRYQGWLPKDAWDWIHKQEAEAESQLKF